MIITRAGSSTSTAGPATHFTGKVRVETCFSTTPPARSKGAYVTFEPGARTNWHTHPAGQTIIIVHGSGRVRREGGPVETVNHGDVVHFEPGEKHWHGASPDCAMTHLTIGETVDGSAVTWMEPVTDEDYGE